MWDNVKLILSGWKKLKEEELPREGAVMHTLPDSGIAGGYLIDAKNRIGVFVDSTDDFQETEPFENLELCSYPCFDSNPKKKHLCIFLNDDKYKDLFALVCAEILNKRTKCRKDDCAELIVTELRGWKKMMDRSVREISEEVERGLFCELAVLRTLMEEMPERQWVKCWTGPDMQPQDFQLGELGVDRSYEVKCRYKNAGKVKISSFDQLDCTQQLYLALVDLGDDRENGQNLTNLVEEITSKLENDIETRKLFMEKVCGVGYRADLPEDEQKKYSVGEIHWYDATDKSACKFPAVKRSLLPPGILDGTYAIAFSQLEQFKVEMKEVLP